MKRMLILVCCLLLAFAVYAAENSAVVGARTATKGAAATVTNVQPVKMDEISVLVTEITQLKEAGVSYDQIAPLANKLDELIRIREATRNGNNPLDACADCLTPNQTIDPVPTTAWAGSVSSNCGTAGKWYASFTGTAGHIYHWDLCPLTPGAGTASFDADIKICNSSCTILTGSDGSGCSGAGSSYLINNWTWACATTGTYYVVVAPYSSYGSHNCIGTASNTFTLQYYDEPPTLPDLAISNLTTCGSVAPGLYNVSFRVTNIGVSTSLATVAHYKWNTVITDAVNVPAIAPTSFFDVFCTIQVNVGAGSFNTLIGYVDAVTGNGPTANDAMTCSLFNPPPNDLCANAIAITSFPANIPIDNTSASDDGIPACGFTNGSILKGMWYTVVGADYNMTASTCNAIGTLGDTKLSVFTGPCTNLVCVGGSDDYSACTGHTLRSTFSWCAAYGVTYYILVGSYSAGGTFQLDVTQGDYCGFDCNTLTNCGTPVEIEPNDVCPPPANQVMLGCPGFGCPEVIPVVYGKQCSYSDVDWWAVCAPGYSKITVTPWMGPNCDVTPVTFKGQFYLNDCASLLGTAFSGAFAITNSGPTPVVIYLKIYNAGGTPPPVPVQYKLTAECCHLANPCDNIIVIPADFTMTVNTCSTDPCGAILNPPGVYEDACAGSLWQSGPSKIFMFHTWVPASNINITCTAAGSGDEQVMVFTNCADPIGSCVASADLYGGGTGPETISNLALPIPGIYYVSVSYYGGACGDITLDIQADVQLPVTMGDVSIVPMDNSVELRWATQSETSLDKWIVKRDNTAVYQVNANNGSSGHHYVFTDENAANGRTYSYDLVVRTSDGTETVVRTLSATPTVGAANVTEYALHQNYPNPFNPTTDIMYDVKDAGFVTLKVYNLMGQAVATLVNSNMTQGRHTVSFNATDLPSGLYLCKMTAGSFSAEVKMLLMK